MENALLCAGQRGPCCGRRGDDALEVLEGALQDRLRADDDQHPERPGGSDLTPPGQRKAAENRIFTMRFPMYVMRVKDALKLTEARCHQALLAEGKLVVFEE